MDYSKRIMLSGVKQYHTSKTISSSPVNFTSSTYLLLGGFASDETSKNLIKAHGTWVQRWRMSFLNITYDDFISYYWHKS
jgi:hypothetical protein